MTPHVRASRFAPGTHCPPRGGAPLHVAAARLRLRRAKRRDAFFASALEAALRRGGR